MRSKRICSVRQPFRFSRKLIPRGSRRRRRQRRIVNMANRSGMFLTPEDRESLLRKVAKYERRRTSRVVSDQGSAGGVDDGCRICGMDNDHGKMLICERCSAEYHYYCVGLQSVPNGDWYCGEFTPREHQAMFRTLLSLSNQATPFRKQKKRQVSGWLHRGAERWTGFDGGCAASSVHFKIR